MKGACRPRAPRASCRSCRGGAGTTRSPGPSRAPGGRGPEPSTGRAARSDTERLLWYLRRTATTSWPVASYRRTRLPSSTTLDARHGRREALAVHAEAGERHVDRRLAGELVREHCGVDLHGGAGVQQERVEVTLRQHGGEQRAALAPGSCRTRRRAPPCARWCAARSPTGRDRTARRERLLHLGVDLGALPDDDVDGLPDLVEVAERERLVEEGREATDEQRVECGEIGLAHRLAAPSRGSVPPRDGPAAAR
jgi:hypothetical protein